MFLDGNGKEVKAGDFIKYKSKIMDVNEWRLARVFEIISSTMFSVINGYYFEYKFIVDLEIELITEEEAMLMKLKGI
jgi:hypothetical protein